jgi:hypothetical protein
MRKRILFLLLLPLFVYADKVPFHVYYPRQAKELDVQAPWTTGPLLASSGFVVPVGHLNFEPYIYAIANTGIYDKNWKAVKTKTFWNNSLQAQFQVGLTNWMDFLIAPTLNYNYHNGAATWSFGDLVTLVDFQLYQRLGRVTDWVMGLKLTLKETIPTGKYQNLNPAKAFTDGGGQGSWQTSAALVWGNLFYIGRGHFLSWRTSLQYTLPAPVHVKNLSIYGGGPGTNGTVYPAQNGQLDTAFELTLTQNWVFAIDFVGSWFGRMRFSGETSQHIGFPTGVQYSIAPAIEYNWSANLGMIVGSWFSIAGRNTNQFASGVIAVNYYH